MLSFIAFIPPKVGIKSCRCATECFICTCIWLDSWANSYRLVHYSYTWLFLTGLSWLLVSYFLLLTPFPFSNLNFLYILWNTIRNRTFRKHTCTLLRCALLVMCSLCLLSVACCLLIFVHYSLPVMFCSCLYTVVCKLYDRKYFIDNKVQGKIFSWIHDFF